MEQAKILWAIILQAVLSAVIDALPDRIPIGAIFDHDSLQIHTAFRFAIMKQNSNDSQPRVKLDATVEFVQVTDSFLLSTAICTQINRGIYALFGVNNVSSINTVLSYSNAFHMPFITPNMIEPDPDKSVSFGIQMLPSYTRAMVDIISLKQWTNFYYLYDTDEALIRIQEINKALHEKNMYVQVDIRRILEVEKAGSLLKHLAAIKKKEPKRFVLDFAKSTAMQNMLDQIADMRLTKRDYHYLLAGLGIKELKLAKLLQGGVNITGLQLVDNTNHTVQKFIDEEWSRLDPQSWPNAGSRSIEYQAALAYDSVNVFTKAVTRLAHKQPEIFRNQFPVNPRGKNGSAGLQCKTNPIVPWSHGAAITQAIVETEHYGLTGHIAFDSSGRRRNYTLGVYEIGYKRGLMKLGTWTAGRGLKLEMPKGSLESKDQKQYDNETVRRVTSILVPPFLIERKSPSKHGEPPIGKKKYVGYCVDLTDHVAKKLDIEYYIDPVKDEKYGAYVQANDSWNGMIGELMRGEADMAVAPLTITADRENVVDFSKPFMSLGISIMIKRPDDKAPGVFSFMDPLSYEIWMCIVFAYIGVSVVLFLVSRFSPYEWHIDESSGSPTAKNDFTIFNSLWFILAAFMQQGCEISPRSFSGRIVGSVWWFFTFIIISSYTANLAAFLTVERMSSVISSAEDLAKQTKIKYGVINAGSSKNFFKKSQIPTYRRMWTFMHSNQDVFTSSTIDGVNRVRNGNGKYAFLLESTMNDYFNQQQPCNTMKVGSNLDSKGYGIATPFNSDLSVHITLAVLELKENGQLHELEQTWWLENGYCGDPQTQNKSQLQSALDLSNVAGIFFILIGGLVVAMFTSVLELLYRAKVEAKRKKISFWKSLKAKAYITLHGELDADNDPLASEISHHYKPMSTV